MSLRVPKAYFVLILIGFLSVGCEQSLETLLSENQQSAEDVNFHPYDVNQFKLNQVVCDPMGSEGQPGLGDGLVASLFYLKKDQIPYRSVSGYIDNGVKSTQKLFFSQLNIPTRLFDLGFPSETGQLLQNDANEDLVEDFALRFRSVLSLAPDDEEGDYELALLSDDGAVMKIMNSEGQFEPVVDNDGNHPTRMGCGDTISMTSDTQLDVEIDYYQGPRYHISLIPMWRKVDSQTQAEQECGQKGNSRYFDFRNNSSPQSTYLNLLARGWKPIAGENWSLPPMAGINPCVSGEPPRISNFSVQDTGEGFVIVRWETDRPATAQVRVVDSQNNEWITESDNVLRTQHQVVVSQGLQFGQAYVFQGISISEDMGKSLSRVLQVQL